MTQNILFVGGRTVALGAILYGRSSINLQKLVRRSSVTMTKSSRGAPQGGLELEPKLYPQIRRDEAVQENFHGQTVKDPYRWLEDPDSKETEQWRSIVHAVVAEQNKLTSSILEQCDTRSKFKDLMTELYNYPKYSCPYKRGGRYYFSYNSGLQAQNVLYTQSELENEATQQILLDPNKLSEDGTVALMGSTFSEDGKLMAYLLGSGGSDWRTVKLKRIDLKTGKAEDLEDVLEHVKFSPISWTHDNKGFFYNRFDKPRQRDGELGTETDANFNQQLFYHRVGTSQSEDVFLLSEPDHPEWMLSPSVTDDGRFLLIEVTCGCEPTNQLWSVDIEALPRDPATGALDLATFDKRKGESAKALPISKIVENFEASYSYVANEGSVFTFVTNLEAPTYRLVRRDITRGTGKSWQDLIPAHEQHLLQWASALKEDTLVVCYLIDVHSVLQVHSLQTGDKKATIPLPGIGSVSAFQSRRQDTEAFFSYTDFVDPGSTFRIDVSEEKLEPKLFRQAKLKGNINLDNFETKQVFATSKDGTKVPMFVVSQKGLQRNKQNPTLLYGYGGFNISLEPGFSVSRLCFMLAYNGIYAVANLRGGGEYGTGWRNAGSLGNKQNVFDDFQACAEKLIADGYCSPQTLSIQGGSNGGLLVAACANQRPDLYSAVVGQVGVMDMLRFKLFTIGHAWVTDYGDVDKPEDFKYIYKYSPLHNVSRQSAGFDGQLPAMLLTTGSHDDRVVPLHSYKLIATLQEAVTEGTSDSAQRNPLLIRIETRAGHGAGKPTAKIIAEAADSYAYIAKAMKASWQHKTA